MRHCHDLNVYGEKMSTYIVYDKTGGVLISLRELVRKIPLIRGHSYRFCDCRIQYGTLLGMNVLTFEKKTSAPGGLSVNANQFEEMLNSDFQMIDGEIEVVICLPGNLSAVITVVCFDATGWEISTTSDELASQLEQSGLTRS